jgi:A/G-specific adenine glycosylase
LPWRATSDPWAILVSELMLQQTRVEVVVRYFTPFLARFPTPAALAAADEAELLARWSGLGYYRRARSLRQAAIEIVARGSLPATAAELVRLPGVGPYTAAAVASIAFREPVGVLDGNVERVMARRLAFAGSVKRSSARRLLLEAVADLLDPARPGDSNQALMELGATLCKPRNPRCGDCPLAEGCRARAAGEPERYPEAKARPRPVAIAVAAAAVANGDRLLLVRRDDDEELMPGLWELPALESELPDPERFRQRYGGDWRFGAPRARVRHSITFRALTITAYAAEWSPAELAEGSGRGWFAAREALELPLTGAARKLVRLLSSNLSENSATG